MTVTLPTSGASEAVISLLEDYVRQLNKADGDDDLIEEVRKSIRMNETIYRNLDPALKWSCLLKGWAQSIVRVEIKKLSRTDPDTWAEKAAALKAELRDEDIGDTKDLPFFGMF
jgi:hypothetical protein